MDYQGNSKNLSPDWNWLRLFNYYRGVLALFFLTSYLNGWVHLLVPPQNFIPSLFYGASVFYVIVFLIFIQTIKHQKPDLGTQVITQTCVDITAIITIMHACGGVYSGLGMLLITNISMTSLFLHRRITLLFAAATSLAILLEQTYSEMVFEDFEAAFVQAGILGTLIFVFAFMTSYIARQLHETEQLVTQKGQELETAVHMNEHIIRNMRTGIMVASFDGKILMANNAAENLLGDVKLRTNAPLEKIAPAISERLKNWLSSNEPTQYHPIQQSHGLPDIQLGFSPIEPDMGQQGRTLIFLEDASQLNLRFQDVKLASLGRLTASIAHEIRNPLAAIHHASQLLDESITDPADTKLTQIINTQVQRLNGVVENVLQISRQQRGTPENIEIKKWLAQFKDEFCSSQGMNAQQINININPESITVLFDSSHLHQVFWNLCSNVISHSGIETSDLVIDLKGGFAENSSQPYIDIIDNGHGIDESIESQIFEPFFTTSTKGSGLGLYITKEVIENNRAKIRHIALPKGGNCFRIYFLHTANTKTTNSDRL